MRDRDQHDLLVEAEGFFLRINFLLVFKVFNSIAVKVWDIFVVLSSMVFECDSKLCAVTVKLVSSFGQDSSSIRKLMSGEPFEDISSFILAFVETVWAPGAIVLDIIGIGIPFMALPTPPSQMGGHIRIDVRKACATPFFSKSSHVIDGDL
jgi:hypothetical protein